jgi:hypothetical protein
MNPSVTPVVKNGNTIVSGTDVYYHNVKRIKEMDSHYTGPALSGYYPERNYDVHTGRLPSVYDGLIYDSDMYQIYDSTFYVTGIVVCVTLLITGIIVASEQ